MTIDHDLIWYPSELHDQQFADPQPLDLATVLEEVDMIPPALAASELQAFMAAGQPRDGKGRWTKGGSFPSDHADADSVIPRKKLTKELRGALKDYIYKGVGINMSLRSDAALDAAQQAIVSQMDDAVESGAFATTGDTVVYRNVSGGFLDSMQTGKVFTDKAFVSTAKSEANNWGEDPNIAIKVPAGTTLLPVNRSVTFNESEVVLPRGTKFKVLERAEGDWSERPYLLLEVVQ